MPDSEAEESSSDEDSDMDSESNDEFDNDDTQPLEATESFTVITNEKTWVQKLVPMDKSNTSPQFLRGEQQQPQLHLREQKPDYQQLVQMSFAHSRFWFLKQYIEDPTTFNGTVLLEVIGTLRKSNLNRAVMVVGQRHEALQTCLFQDEHQLPMQGVLGTSALRLEAVLKRS